MSVDKKRYGSTLYKMARLGRDIFPAYNRHIYRILNKLDEVAVFSKQADTVGFENIDDVIRETTDLLSLHSNYNKNTVHGETKATLGLGQVNNLRLATEEEAITGETNDRYITPYMAGQSIDHNAVAALISHINDHSNPHNETAAQIGGMAQGDVNTIVQNKYLKTETVEGANFGILDTKKTVEDIITEYRTNMPPDNFTHGLVDPRRVAGGTPNANTVAMADGRRWTSINEIATNPDYSGRMIAAATFNSSYNTTSALNHLRTNQPYMNLPNGSIVLFTVQERLGSAFFGYNNGHSGTQYHDVGVGHVAVKYGPNNWQVI